MATYSIKDIERLSGIKAHTIRIWEQRFHLIEPQRTATNIRYYSDDDLVKLMNIAILNQNGYKISKIAQLKDTQFKNQLFQLNNTIPTIDIQLEGLSMSMIYLDESRFNHVLSISLEQIGFEATVEQLLFPFLKRIGELWLAGTIIPAQEHFISNLIRQLLIAAIANLKTPGSDPLPRILFYLPEGEFHEIGLLYYNYLARKSDFEVIYLGTSIPFRDIVNVDAIRPVHIIFTSFVTSVSSEALKTKINKLKTAFPDKTLLVSGWQLKVEKANLPENFYKITSSADFKKALSRFLKKWI